MRHLFAAATAVTLLPLAACNQGASVSMTNVSGSEVANKIATSDGALDTMSPGRWEGTVTIHDMKMPGLPAAQQAELAGKMGKAESIVSCVTPQEVKERKAFFTGDEMKRCTYEHYTMAGGKLDAKVSCDNDGTKMGATMTGTYSADHFNMTMDQNMQGADADNPYGTMSSKVTIDTKRVGECRGDENKRPGRHADD